MTSIIIFWVALLGLISLFSFKIFENKHKMVLLANLRARVDLALVSVLNEAHEQIVTLPDKISLQHFVRTFTHRIVLFFSEVAKFANVKAESLAMRISRNAREHAVGKKRQASDFLRDVGEHKQSLDRDEIKRETSL